MNSRPLFAALSLLTLFSACANCGAGANGIDVTLSPDTVTVPAGQKQQFTATVAGTDDQRVFWSVDETAGGSIDESGLYTAPAAAGAFHVTVTSRADVSKVAHATITVTGSTANPIVVGVAPQAVSLGFGQTQQFVASVAGSESKTVRWSVQEGTGGSVSANGVYTAPNASGTFHVQAAAEVDPSAVAVATVTVSAAAGISVTVTPMTLTLGSGESRQLSAQVSGTANTAVTWSVMEQGGGNVTAGGYYTAPAAAGVYHVLATSSADPTRFGAATVTVTPVAISLSPTAAIVEIGSTQQLTASVTGTANAAVTWSVVEGTSGGMVSSTGLYTPPSTPGLFHVQAVSVADGSKSATSTLTVIQPVTVLIAPSSANLQMQQTLQFTATVVGNTNQAVTWSIDEGALGGSITAGGLYSAPIVTQPTQFHVTATPQANPAKASKALVTVSPGVGVQITPAAITLAPGAMQPFTASVTGTTNTQVTWSLQEGANGGVITSTGAYTAPAKSGTYHVVATSAADTTQRAFATVIVLGNPVTITGTVSYSGSASGRVYIVLAPDETSAGLNGTSVALTNGTATFTLQGFQQRGDFNIRAFMDTQNNGMYHVAKDPYVALDVTVTDAGLSNVALQLTDSSWSGWTSMAVPSLDRVIAADGSAAIVYTPSYDPMGNDECPRYSVYWDTTPQVSSTQNVGSMTFAANAPHIVIVRGLTNGDQLYFTMSCPDVMLFGGNAPAIGPITVGAPAGGFTLNGVVDGSALSSLTNAPLYVFALSDTAAYMTKVLAPVAQQNWSMSGVTAGTYQVYAMRDVSDDGKVTPTDPATFFDPVAVTVAANQTAPAIAMSGANAVPRISTWHIDSHGSESYGLTLRVRPNVKRPVRVQLTSGPKLAVPFDLPIVPTGGALHQVDLPLGSIAPAVRDSYSFTVTYADGTSEVLEAQVQTVLPTTVVTSPGMFGSTVPTFTWLPLSPAPTSGYTTSVTLYDFTYFALGAMAQPVGQALNLPGSQTTLLFGDLKPTVSALSANNPYWYTFVAADNAGNWSQVTDTFVAR
jgi:hypothetical protein